MPRTLESFSKLPNWLKSVFRNLPFSLIWGIYVNQRIFLSDIDSYSQVGEDIELRKWLPENEGIYIDVGAGYPIQSSNSYYFYKLGYTGWTIDPILSNFLLHKIFRRRDRAVLSLVSSKKGVTTFYQFRPYELSTTDQKVCQEILISKKAKLVKIKNIKTVQLSDLGLKISPLDAAFFTIDTEGNDLRVLKGNDFGSMKPRVICVEDPLVSSDKFDNIERFLQIQGYVYVKHLTISKIFVAEEYLEMLNNAVFINESKINEI
jgi:hypothetical protein